MKSVIASALVAHWRRNSLQLFTLLAGLALATALWSGVQAINGQARASYDAAAATLGEGQFDRILRRDGRPLATTEYVAMRRNGWLVSPVIQGNLDGVRIVGIDPATSQRGIGPDGPLDRFITSGGQVFAALDVTLDFAPYRRVTAADIAPATAITDIAIAQALLSREDEIDLLVLAPRQPVGQRDLPATMTIQTAQGGSDLASLTDSFHLNLTAFGLLSFAVGIFIVHGAIGLAFEQRRGMIRTLRALGVPLRALMFVMVAELSCLALIGGAIGVLLGYLVAGALLPDVAATLRGLYGASVSGVLSFDPALWLSGLAVSVGGTFAAATAGLIGLVRMPMLAASRPRAMAMASGRRAHIQMALAVLLLLVAAILGLTATGLVAGFTLLGVLLIGAALGLPALIGGVIRLCQTRARGVLAQWFWADTRQQLGGLSLALMALLLAMAANVGVSTMVSSFRTTFVGFLDQRLSSELYVTADSAEMAAVIVDVATPLVDAVLPIVSVDAQIAGQKVAVFGAVDHATYRDNWRFLQDDQPWDRVAGGAGILVNEQFARRTGLWVGSGVTLGPEKFTIAGVYGDYGNPVGQAVIAMPRFMALYPEQSALRFGLRLQPAQVDALGAQLVAAGIPEANMINQAGIKSYSLDVFERTFTVTAALNVLTLAVAGFAMLMSLLTLSNMRLPQLAPVWALGLTRRMLWRIEILRALMLALFTAILAIPLGLVLAWALLAIVNVAAFGWELPMFLFPADYLRLVGFAIVAAVAAAIWPALRLSRTPPSDLLKVFSNER